MSSSVFKGEKVIFSTLPGSHLSFGCHNNLDVAKVARAILGVSQHAKSWRSGHTHKGTGISLTFSGKAGTQFGVPKLEQLGKPCHGNVCVLLQWCSHRFITAAPTEVGDAIPLPLGWLPCKSPMAFYRRHLFAWRCLCLGSCLFLLLRHVFLDWV